MTERSTRKGIDNDSDRPETASERIIHRHIENEHDEITEADIRNVRVESSKAAAEILNKSTDLAASNESLDQELDDMDREKSTRESSPWDVID